MDIELMDRQDAHLTTQTAPLATRIVEHAYADGAALAAAVAAHLHDATQRALSHRGHALLCLAGGRTPFPAYRAFAASAGIDWDDVAIVPGDERCIAHAHPACNVAGLRAAFASATGLRIESLTTPNGDPTTSLAQARAMLALHHDAFDAVVLGMGEDAHTASLFPGATGLPFALDPSAAHDAFLMQPEPLPADAPYARITLGLARLRRARTTHLLVTGARKREVLRAALAANDPLRHPVAAVLRAAQDVRVHWCP